MIQDQELDVQGICGTCNSRWACLSLCNSRERGEPILFCESFDDVEDIAGSDQQVNCDKKTTENRDSANETESSDGEGLCANCENQTDCVFPDHGKNVVHCEEYTLACADEKTSIDFSKFCN